MGGNAFNFQTRRIPREEYESIKQEVEYKLGNYYPFVRDIPCYHSKADFGDLDLLVPNPRPDNLRGILGGEFNPREVLFNNRVVSFEYKDFQIDLVHVEPECLTIAKTYFSFNDLGMLMGMLAKSLHCKYGDKGLYYEYLFPPNRHMKKEFFLTRDPKLIFDFLGLSYRRYLEGFDTLEDIFEFIISSRWFNADQFLQQTDWNHRRRKRNAKRPTWIGFQEYLKSREVGKKMARPDNLLQFASDCFPEANLASRVEHAHQTLERKEKVKQKFNGELVMKLTGLKGKELGQFIGFFKSCFVDFDQFILDSSQEEIETKIRKLAS